MLPLGVLLLFAVAVGMVNFERWGSPFSFIDFRYYDFSNLHRQNDLAVLRNYGEIDLGRAWIGALYYTTGVPYVLKAVSPFAEFLHSRYQAIEAPRSRHFLPTRSPLSSAPSVFIASARNRRFRPAARPCCDSR